jgi:23S rRNA pseudouridine955/2504/2580 synthase
MDIPGINYEFEYEESGPRQDTIKIPRITNVRDLILFEDEDVLILNKPPYVSTLDERAEGFGPGLLRLVKKVFPTAQAAHRLDKETSGVIAFSKHPAAYRNLAMQFEHRQVTKIYHAITIGTHQLEGVRVFLPILQMNGGYVVIDRAEGKEAETIFNTKEVFRGYTLVECYPITGRMHQIRIHLKCVDASIVADPRYGGKLVYLSDIKKKKFKLKGGTEELPLISRVALHAREFNFAMMNGERKHIEAPYPKDFDACLTQLRKYAGA